MWEGVGLLFKGPMPRRTEILKKWVFLPSQPWDWSISELKRSWKDFLGANATNSTEFCPLSMFLEWSDASKYDFYIPAWIWFLIFFANCLVRLGMGSLDLVYHGWVGFCQPILR